MYGTLSLHTFKTFQKVKYCICVSKKSSKKQAQRQKRLLNYASKIFLIHGLLIQLTRGPTVVSGALFSLQWGKCSHRKGVYFLFTRVATLNEAGICTPAVRVLCTDHYTQVSSPLAGLNRT